MILDRLVHEFMLVYNLNDIHLSCPMVPTLSAFTKYGVGESLFSFFD